MPIYNLTKDKIDEFQEQLKNKKNQYDIIETSTPKSLWIKDLDDLEEFMKKNNYYDNKKKKLKIIKNK